MNKFVVLPISLAFILLLIIAPESGAVSAVTHSHPPASTTKDSNPPTTTSTNSPSTTTTTNQPSRSSSSSNSCPDGFSKQSNGTCLNTSVSQPTTLTPDNTVPALNSFTCSDGSIVADSSQCAPTISTSSSSSGGSSSGGSSGSSGSSKSSFISSP